jgi:hypothetical protein
MDETNELTKNGRLRMHRPYLISFAEKPKGKLKHTLLAMLLDSQSSPSYNPSPVVAQVLWMYLQARTRIHQVIFCITYASMTSKGNNMRIATSVAGEGSAVQAYR